MVHPTSWVSPLARPSLCAAAHCNHLLGFIILSLPVEHPSY